MFLASNATGQALAKEKLGAKRILGTLMLRDGVELGYAWVLGVMKRGKIPELNGGFTPTKWS